MRDMNKGRTDAPNQEQREARTMMEKLPEFLVALLLLQVSSWAQDPAPPLENTRRVYGGSLQHQTEDSPQGTVLYFPDYVDGDGWAVQLTLSNINASTAAVAVVEVYGQDGQPVLDLFDSESQIEIPSFGSRVLRSAGAGPIRRGWIQVRTDPASVTGLLTYRQTGTGVEVSVEPVELDSRFALFVEESDTLGAGLAIFKPEASSGIELQIRDEEGHNPLEGESPPWRDFKQAARTLPEWFGVEGVDTDFLMDFRGLLFVGTANGSRFAPLGLRFGKRSPALSAVPAIRNPGQEPLETILYFPDYVDGGGWAVQLALSNVDASTAAVAVVEVYGQDGQPVLDLFDSESRFEIPSLGSRILRSGGAGPIRRGWIQVRTDPASVTGLLTYRQTGTGVEVSVGPVELGNRFALFVEESDTLGAGLAIFKPEASSEIELRIRDEEGENPLEGEFLPWRDFKQAAHTLPEWFGAEGIDTDFLTGFRGLLFVQAEDGSRFAPLGLRFGKRSPALSAVPVIRITEGGDIEGRDRPPAPTVTLSASPSSIDLGQSATLSWSSTNAESAMITPGIGKVPTSGSRRVTPMRTTTYRITVRSVGGQTQTAMASATVTVTISERAALGALYAATGGVNWSRRENWLTDRPLGEWSGVTVDAHGRVIGLSLRDNDLTGADPVRVGRARQPDPPGSQRQRSDRADPFRIGLTSQPGVPTARRQQSDGTDPVRVGLARQLGVPKSPRQRSDGTDPVRVGLTRQLELPMARRQQSDGTDPVRVGLARQPDEPEPPREQPDGADPVRVGLARQSGDPRTQQQQSDGTDPFGARLAHQPEDPMARQQQFDGHDPFRARLTRQPEVSISI